MPTYRIETETTGREVYLVDADSPEEAQQDWSGGSLLVSEVMSSEVSSVQVEES